MRTKWWCGVAFTAAVSLLGVNVAAQTTAPPSHPLAESLLRQLVDINTTFAHGTTAAAKVVQKAFLDAGFPSADVQLLGPTPKYQNLLVFFRGASTKRPILLLGHLDVVPANPSLWHTDPYHLVIKDGVYYGRGTQDMKEGDAIFAATLIRLKKEGFRPNRTIILALTAGEETGVYNGADWLFKNRPELDRVAYVLNADTTAIDAVNGVPKYMSVDAAEKRYADFEFVTTNPGGHSSMPVPDNAIYHLADALARLQHFRFPVEIDSVTRAYFQARLKIDRGQLAADERAMLETPPSAAAAQRLSADPLFNGTLRTTCVATMLKAGEANNALPERASAIVNCRILPGHSPAQVQKQLEAVVNDPKVAVRYVDSAGKTFARAPATVPPPPQPLQAEVMVPLERLTEAMWHIPVIPDLSLGASDDVYVSARGIPSYCFSGILVNEDDERAHAANENLSIRSFDRGAEFYYRILRLLTGGKLKIALPPEPGSTQKPL